MYRLDWMKRNVSFFLVFFLFLSSGLSGQEVDILKNYNGDFENGITFWRFFEVPNNIGSSWEVTSDAVAGEKAMKLNWVASDGSVQDRGFDNWSAGVLVIAGEDYTVKAFMKSDTPSGLKVNMLMGFFTSSGSVIFPQYSTDCQLTDSYTEHELSVTAPADAATCWVAFRMYDASGQRVAGTVYLDSVRIMGPAVDLPPRLMPVTLPSEDLPVAGVNVMDPPYNAKNDGSEDATTAFQNAINRASVAGGAVVFVPAGRYRLDGTLNIPERVILRGEWQNPDSAEAAEGTILMPYGGKGSEDGTPFISIQRGAGIKDLVVFYPEQDIASVSPYPWTIHCHPDGDAGSGDNTSVINVTLVNAYNGIKIGPNWNELHYVRNVYGTPLHQGIWLSQTTDIGRLENIHFEPKYWAGSALGEAPSENAILQWMKDNLTVGIIMGRSDWEYIYDVSFVGYHIGMQIIKYTDMGPNGVAYGLRIEKSNIGIDLVDLNPIGWAFTNALIQVEGDNAVCVRTSDNFTSGVQFNTCSFGGDPVSVVKFSSNATGRLSFQNCTFEDWGQGTGDIAAVDCEKGSLALLGNTFLQDQKQIRLGSSVPNAQILDNRFPGELIMENNSSGQILVSDEPLDLKKLDVPPHPYAPVRRPVGEALYSVIDFGAVGDGQTDNTVAFQAALDSAGNNGGGTVYVPAGMYAIRSHLMVPSGVELRGIFDVPHHTISRGSVLLAYEGQGDENATPFISLQSGSGIRGVTIWYPEQNDANFFPYPWSIRALGEGCWIRDVVLSDTWQGVDLATYAGGDHVVSYLAGAPLKTGLFVDKSTGDGWIENVQFNPHYWQRSSGYPQEYIPDIGKIIVFQQAHLDAFKIASAGNEHVLGTFVYAASKGLYLAPDDGNSRIDVFLHGTDAGSDGVCLESMPGSTINLVNTQLVVLGAVQNGIITSAANYGAEASFFNTISWGGSGPTANLQGNGKILVQQIRTHNGVFKLSHGNTRLENVTVVASLNPQYIIGQTTEKVRLFGSYASNGLIKYDYQEDRSAVEVDYCYYNTNVEKGELTTSWESTDVQNTWDNTFFGHKAYVIEDPFAYRCEAIDTEVVHTGTYVLAVAAGRIGDYTPLYKIFDQKIPVTGGAVLSYWVNPQNEAGRGGCVDLLFTDGTRLTELGALAEDGLPLNAPRGGTGQWTEVICHIGQYAAGKTIQSILTGVETDTADSYAFLLDDLFIDGALSVKPVSQDNVLHGYNYPDPFSCVTNISFLLQKNGYVTLEVYNLAGEKISVLKDHQTLIAGNYDVSWYPYSLPGGIYFFRLEFLSETGSRTVVTDKMLYIK